ncbi:MAG: SBBP repeat-containing protein, partial [Nitrospirota bacterium]|nr:SBBP repeat-containing protein [Nitrospirota bacterium]
YLGGNSYDSGSGIFSDSMGNAYVTGGTSSTNFPTLNAIQATDPDPLTDDVFVSKINPAGSAFVYSTYLGGTGSETGRRIAIDCTGRSAYLTGTTFSSNFPVTPGAYNTSFDSPYEIFISKITEETIPQNVIDLSVTKTDAPDPVEEGQPLTYTVHVSNLCANTATGVTLTDILPAGVTFLSVDSDRGSCQEAGHIVSCDLGIMSSQDTATITIEVVPVVSGLIENTVTVAANEPETNYDNNIAIAETTVPLPDYTLTVTKDGTGGGTVASLVPLGGIICGNDCTETYPAGTLVTLQAIPGDGGNTGIEFEFAGWGGDPDCEDGVVLMDADKTCTAEFIDIADLQFDAFLMLKNESEKPVQIRFERGIPRFIDMRVPIPAALQDNPVSAALDFLIRYKNLLTDTTPREHPLKQYYLKRIVTDSLAAVGGGTPDPNGRGQHLFFGQHIDGIPVYAASLAIHMKGGKITGYNGNYLA